MLQAYTSLCPVEIGGLGLVRVLDDGLRLLVEDILIVEQACSGGSCDLDDQGIATLLLELIERGVDPSRLNLWWHSHAKMPAFFSRTDLHTLETSFPSADWVLGIVTNHRGELVNRLHIQRPISIRLLNVPIALQLPFDNEELVEKVVSEIARKVRPAFSFITHREDDP